MKSPKIDQGSSSGKSCYFYLRVVESGKTPNHQNVNNVGKHSLVYFGVGILDTRSNGTSKITLGYTYATPLPAALAIAPR